MGHVEEGGVQVHEAGRPCLRCVGLGRAKTAIIQEGVLASWSSSWAGRCSYGSRCIHHREARLDQTHMEVSVYELQAL